MLLLLVLVHGEVVASNSFHIIFIMIPNVCLPACFLYYTLRLTSTKYHELVCVYLKPQINSRDMHIDIDITFNGTLTRYVKLQVAHAPGMPGTFPPATDFKGNR